MKRLLILTMTVITIALFATSAVAYELPNYTEEVMENVADWLDADVVSIERSEVEGLAHYTAILKVGDGDYDTIGVHRVVKESWPGIPQYTEEGVFCIHGDMNTFNLIYMTGTLSGYQEDEDSLGVYMAQNGIDVWGIDLRWALIPPVAPPTMPGEFPDQAGAHHQLVAGNLGVCRALFVGGLVVLRPPHRIPRFSVCIELTHPSAAEAAVNGHSPTQSVRLNAVAESAPRSSN